MCAKKRSAYDVLELALRRETRKRIRFQALAHSAIERLGVERVHGIVKAPPLFVVTAQKTIMVCARCGKARITVRGDTYEDVIECARMDGWYTCGEFKFYCPAYRCRKRFRQQQRLMREEDIPF